MLWTLLLLPLLASPPAEVAFCLDRHPLSAHAATQVAERVTAARIIGRARCPASGFRASIVDGADGVELLFQTPDGRRLRRRLFWLNQAEGGLFRTTTGKHFGLFAGMLASVIADATLNQPSGPVLIDAAPAPDARPAPPRVTPPPRRARVVERAAKPRRRPPRPAPERAPEPAPAPMPPPPSPVGVVTEPPRAPPAPEAAPFAVAVVRPPVTRPPVARPIAVASVPPPRGVSLHAAVDLGIRARGAAGVAPDTAVRLGIGQLLAEVDWQPEADFTAQGRPLRVSALAMAVGVDWPAYASDRWRLALPLTLTAERSVLRRLDLDGAAHALWQGGARAGARLAWGLPGGWFLEASVDGRLMPLGGVAVTDGPTLDFNQLSGRMGLGLLFVAD